MPETSNDMVMCDFCDVVLFACAGLQKALRRKEQWICRECVQTANIVHTVCVCSFLFSNIIVTANILHSIFNVESEPKHCV